MALTNGQTYYYSIFTYDANGNYSAPITATATPHITVDPVTITEAAGGDLKIQLSWSKSTIATSYKIYYGTAPENYGTPLVVLSSELADPENPEYLIQDGITNNTTYWIAITAIYADVESTKSPEISVVTGETSVLSQPANLVAQNGDASVRLTWDTAFPAVDGYIIRYGTSPNVYTGTGATEGDSPITVNGNISTIDIHGLTNDTLYYFTIQAFKTIGNLMSLMSYEVSALPQAGLTEYTEGSVVALQLQSSFNLIGVPVAMPEMTLKRMLSQVGGSIVIYRDSGKFKSLSPVVGADQAVQGANAYYVNIPSSNIPAGETTKTVKLTGNAWKQV